MSFNPTVQPRGDSASLNPASVLGQGWKRGLSEFSVPLPPHFWPELSYTQPFLVRRVQQKCWLGDEVLLLQKKVRKTADGSILILSLKKKEKLIFQETMTHGGGKQSGEW